MKPKLRAILYAIFIALLPVSAAECMTLEQVKKDAAEYRPPFVITELDKAETEDFLGKYNILPPATNMQGDYSVMISRDQSVNVVFIYFWQNCAIETLFMKRKFFDDLRNSPLAKPVGQRA